MIQETLPKPLKLNNNIISRRGGYCLIWKDTELLLSHPEDLEDVDEVDDEVLRPFDSSQTRIHS